MVTLGDDDKSRSGSVGLGQVGDGGSDLSRGRVGHALSGGIGSSLGLVSNQNVDIGQELLELDLEELGNKGGREVEDDDLALSTGLLGNLEGRDDTVSQEESSNVKELCIVQQGLDLGLLKVVRGELFSSLKGGAERPVVTSDHHGAGTRSGVLVDLVGGLDTLLVVGSTELVSELVLSDRSNVSNVLCGQDVGGSSSGVLGGTSSEIGNLVILDDFIVAEQTS